MKREIKRGSCNFVRSKYSTRAQVTIFVILAILIIGGVGLYFALRETYKEELPQNMRPVYDYYLSCLEETAGQGIALLGEQGGYIEAPDFIPGSSYMPFSSQLDFFGQPIPYWMYVSGNNLLKEQVPTESSMEEELEQYIEERLNYCDFSDFELQGYGVFIDEGDVNVKINDLNVDVGVDNPVIISFENQSGFVNQHKISIKSKLGKFYNLALDVYNFEKKDMFFEKYGLDVMRLYAPVDGVELTCSPKVFVDEVIKQDLKNGLAANIGVMKLKGGYYDLRNKENNYFVTDIGRNVDENVQFVYHPNWPTRIEIYGDRVVEPVGLQEGLGILGFCYVSYHLVYDINFPVLIQFYDTKELFQFPIGVIINKNQARNALPTEAGVSIESEVCRYKNQKVRVYVYGSELEPVKARIKFKCLNTECSIGESEIFGEDSIFEDMFPKCVNGFVIAKADGYADAKAMISTNEETDVNIIMDKLYNVSVDVNSGGFPALVSFKSDEHSATIMYPDSKEIQLIDGYYNVSVYVYKNTSLKFPAVSSEECVSVPQKGVAGLFGLEEEKCFDINLPEHEVDFAVVGGGHVQEYVAESQLRDSGKLNVKVQMFKTPASIEELQDNYMEIENSILGLEFV